MRDKLIDIILAAQGGKDIDAMVAEQGYWTDLLLNEVRTRQATAGKIADALIAAGVVLVKPVTFSVGHPDPVGAKGEPGVVGIPAGEWVSVEDALPEDGKWCAIITRDGYYCAGNYIAESKSWAVRGDYCWGDFGKGYVEYWMPLPAPPKEE